MSETELTNDKIRLAGMYIGMALINDLLDNDRKEPPKLDEFKKIVSEAVKPVFGDTPPDDKVLVAITLKATLMNAEIALDAKERATSDAGVFDDAEYMSLLRRAVEFFRGKIAEESAPAVATPKQPPTSDIISLSA